MLFLIVRLTDFLLWELHVCDESWLFVVCGWFDESNYSIWL